MLAVSYGFIDGFVVCRGARLFGLDTVERDFKSQDRRSGILALKEKQRLLENTEAA